MPTKHIGKRIESPEVDCLQDTHFGWGSCTPLVLFHTDVSDDDAQTGE